MKSIEYRRMEGRFLQRSGLLFGAAALLVALYNMWDDDQAGKRADMALQLISDMIPERVGTIEEQILEISSMSEVEYPDYVLNPDMEMTVKPLNGQEYVGVIELPTLSLKLPVISEWSEMKLKLAPCRYKGSVYTKDLIVAGHSYRNHFRYIRKMQIGDPAVYTDMDGNRFVYEVTGMEVIAGSDTAKMEEGEWDLTMFTCTPNGTSRYTVRCTLSEDENPWEKY